MGKKPAGQRKRKDPRPGGKEAKAKPAQAPRQRQPVAQASPKNARAPASKARRPPREEETYRARGEEKEFLEEREDEQHDKESPRMPPKAAERKRESHWIDFATKEQKDIVHEEINMFGNGDEPWQALVVRGDNNVFLYQKGTFTSIHLMPKEAKDRFKGLMGNPGLKHFGLFLGMFKGNQFNLSIEGASELARSGTVARNWIKLGTDGEKSFLYGQDIKKAMLQEVCPRGITHDRGICIILNARGECLGIGKLEAQDPRLVRVSDEDVLVKNIVDRGVYLRDQNRYA
ncbi:MAG: hypothetical protein GYA24_25770 [Candidatus Lokiarchaeota archaeon]|nr:hypothetical protein [Candidatus Lokiarchaeota archaeon]